jgi:YD repeat-containing protein
MWREDFAYDGNGNRLSKTTSYGTIAYAYDEENRLVSKGEITYTHDEDGNLLTEKGTGRTAEYVYNGENRMVRSTMYDTENERQMISEYRYDVFGRRTLAKDAGRETM